MTFTWPIDRSGLPPLPVEPDPVTPGYIAAVLQRNGAEAMAVQILHALSGRQFGLQTQTVRPCPIQPLTPGGRTTYSLLSWAGHGWTTYPCGCLGSCVLAGPFVVHLPGPVHAVTEVKIGGAVLPSNVWVVEGNALYRREAPWPTQNLGRPLGDVGTWSVTYERGIPAPSGVATLTGLLAAEIVAALDTENGRCRLPRTVTTVSRQGVTYRAYDPAVIYASGKTGLPEIDLWFASVNPNALMASPTVV